MYDFVTELLRDQRVSDATWERAVAAFGERGVVDIVGINGYYAFLAMLMNAAQTPAPTSQVGPLV